MDGKGSRSGPPNEKPNMASTTRSVDWREELKSFTNGTERLWSWVLRRWCFCQFAYPIGRKWRGDNVLGRARSSLL